MTISVTIDITRLPTKDTSSPTTNTISATSIPLIKLTPNQSHAFDLDAGLHLETNNTFAIKISGNQLTAVSNGRGFVALVNSSGAVLETHGVVVGTGKSDTHVPICTVSEDDPLTSLIDLQRRDVRYHGRYIYLNGGPGDYGWAMNYSSSEWATKPYGTRARNYIRNSRKLGIVPIFVYYNIPAGNESYTTDLANAQSPEYMTQYFADLNFLLDIVNQESPDDIVQIILEPDFIGYLMQNQQPSGLFADLVSRINSTISSKCPQAEFGWQINLWGNPKSIPGGKGICRSSDTFLDLNAANQFIVAYATEIANYYLAAGIMSHGAHFWSIDKYGLDYELTSGGQSVADCAWAFNSDHWNNYLLVCKTLSDRLGTMGMLWQMPVGHINTSSSGHILDGSPGHGQDSSASWFMGDTFQPPDNDSSHWRSNRWNDSSLSTNGQTITWKSHLSSLASHGISTIMFGAGVGISTTNLASPLNPQATDGGFLNTKIQQYYGTSI